MGGGERGGVPARDRRGLCADAPPIKHGRQIHQSKITFFFLKLYIFTEDFRTILAYKFFAQYL